MSAKASGADSRSNGDAKNRTHHDGSYGRTFTVEQKAAVIRIKRCSPTAFYEILGLEEVKATCSEGEIKKAYRKLSLLTHPDKNGYDGADEAFKLVSRAFQVLSDPDKKAKFDRFGGDPDNRFPGASSTGASPFGNFARGSSGSRPGPMFEEELTPEDLFRQFFGGGGAFGGRFGGGGSVFDTPGFVFNMGGPGIRVTQFGGGRPRRRPATTHPTGNETPPSLSSTLSSLLPLLFLFVLPLLSSMLGGGTTSQGPSFTFDAPRGALTEARTSLKFAVPYWVNPNDVRGYSTKELKRLDETADHKYVHIVNVRCEDERMQQTRMIQEATGWLFQDQDKLTQARKMPMPNCKKLRDLGVSW